ncbi:MAG: 5-oxoprolinase subunit PxpB [Rudaea sp.]
MGDAALLIELGGEIDPAVNSRVHALAASLSGEPGITSCIPAYASLLVEFDPLFESDLRERILSALESAGPPSPFQSRIVEIPTRYGGEFGPDLDFVAARSGLSPKEVIRLHTAEPFRVFMLGFAPGFPYAGPLPAAIVAPRLETPRPRVPAGSVAIAGRQTGIYPLESPGGWRLIGRTDLVLFDAARDPPALLRPGDYMRFVLADP